MSLVIRDVEVSDAAATLSILKPIIAAKNYSSMQTLNSLAEQTRFIQEFPACGLFLVAVEASTDSILGMQDVCPTPDGSTTPTHGEISTFVNLQRTRQGVGKALMQATQQRALGMGYQSIAARVRADNPGALGFYASQGFREVERIPRQLRVDGTWVDIVVNVKNLGGLSGPGEDA